MRIALMVETGGPGGAEHMLLHLAEELGRRGHDVCPVGPDDRSDWLAGEFRARGFSPERYSMRRLVDFRCLRQIVGLLRRRDVDVVHSHEFTMGVYGAAAAMRIGRPHVITMHGGRYYAGKLQRRLALGMAARRSQTVGVSASAAADLERTLWLRRGSVHVIPNGVAFRDGDPTHLRRELGLGAEDLLVVAVGNLYPVKGHVILLHALATLAAQRGAPPCHVAIAGQGAEEAPLRDVAAARGIASHVHLLGYRSDAADVLAAADVFAMPSLSEGLPLALLEAMGAAKPIVASAVGGIPEAVSDGREALLVPPGDDAAFAAALARLLGDEALRASLGAAAQRRVREHYSVEKMTDQYEALYERGQRLGGGAD